MFSSFQSLLISYSSDALQNIATKLKICQMVYFIPSIISQSDTTITHVHLFLPSCFQISENLISVFFPSLQYTQNVNSVQNLYMTSMPRIQCSLMTRDLGSRTWLNKGQFFHFVNSSVGICNIEFGNLKQRVLLTVSSQLPGFHPLLTSSLLNHRLPFMEHEPIKWRPFLFVASNKSKFSSMGNQAKQLAWR